MFNLFILCLIWSGLWCEGTRLQYRFLYLFYTNKNIPHFAKYLSLCRLASYGILVLKSYCGTAFLKAVLQFFGTRTNYNVTDSANAP